MASDYRVTCYSMEWWELVPFAGVGIFVYMILMLVGMASLLLVGRKHLMSSRWTSRVGLLFEMYTAEWYFWELILMTKRTCGVFLGAFSRPGTEIGK